MSLQALKGLLSQMDEETGILDGPSAMWAGVEPLVTHSPVLRGSVSPSVEKGWCHLFLRAVRRASGPSLGQVPSKKWWLIFIILENYLILL